MGGVLEAVYRKEGLRLLAYLSRRLGDIELAEDVLQSALLAAQQRWAESGVPDHPAAWLATVAYRRAVDELRRRNRTERLPPESVELIGTVDADPTEGAAVPDDRLALIFALCHPAIAPSVRSALVLQLAAGLTAVELGRIFLTPPATMGQRLTRAKRKIRAAAIPLSIPQAHELPARVAAVRTVIYLIFTEAHAATRGTDLIRKDLAREAIALGKVLVELLEEHSLSGELAETLGLLALMILHEARALGRVDHAGDLLTLEEQNREQWDRGMIAEGVGVLERALKLPGSGPYQIEAAIAALHAEAQRFEETDWKEMLLLYDALRSCKPGLVVEVNRAVVVDRLHGPERALESVREALGEAGAAHYAPLWLLLGELYRRTGATESAFDALSRALALSENERTEGHIRKKLHRLGSAAVRG